MKYSDIKTSVLAQFNEPDGHHVVPFILGAPGGGKSACARDIIRSLEIPEDNVVELVASLRDPVDVLGTPNNTDQPFTKWTPPEEFYNLRQGVGRAALILEELSDAPIPMQNALCGVIYDRRAGNHKLTDQLFIIATGNRTEDKSGANRITTKLAGRTRRFDFTENIDDFTEWALANDIPAELIQFLRFRPNLLSAFDPNVFASPTPRNWSRVARIPTSLPDQLFFDNVAGDVGEGAAAEYTGFRRIYKSLPNPDAIMLDPLNAAVPSDPATRFALTGALSRKTTVNNIDRVMQYTARMPVEFNVMYVKDTLRLCPDILHTSAFSKWAAENGDVLC